MSIMITGDELDYYMLFLKEGLYFENTKWTEHHRLSLYAYTDDLDKYYLFKEGLIPYATKPRFDINKEYENIIRDLENTNKIGFTKITTFLLGLSSMDQKKILELISKSKKLSITTNCDYKFFLYYKREKSGVLFVIRKNDNKKEWLDFENFLEVMMYKYRLDTGLMIMILFNGQRDVLDFKLFEHQWKFNVKKERMLKKFSFKGMKFEKG